MLGLGFRLPSRTLGRGFSALGGGVAKEIKQVLSVALVGRPNVGKSTLYNRLTKTRSAIVSSVPGTTRDRREGKGYLAGLPLRVIDTGGLDNRGEVATHIQDQVKSALMQSDIVFFMVDARAGVTELDRHYAKWLRQTIGEYFPNTNTKANADQKEKEKYKQVVVIANKVEGAHQADFALDTVSESLRLGFGEPLLISASHGDGLTDIASSLHMHATVLNRAEDESDEAPLFSRRLSPVEGRVDKGYKGGLEHEHEHEHDHESLMSREDRDVLLEEHFPTNDNTSGSGSGIENGKVKTKTPVFSHNRMPVEERIIQLAVMGRPNVGKSSILNAIVGDERCITGNMAGLTRDSVHVEWELFDRRFRLVDTAGLTRTRAKGGLIDVAKENRLVKTQERKGMAESGSSSKTGTSGQEGHTPIQLPGIRDLDPEQDPSQFSYQVSEMSLISALNALKFAQVVCLVVESSQGNFSKIDMQLARKALSEGRGLVIVANKSDLLTGGVTVNSYETGVKEHSGEYLREFGDIPVVATCAISGKGVHRALREVIRVHDAWSRRVDTWVLNEWLDDALATFSETRTGGKAIKIKYITQIGARPPKFLLFTNLSTPELPGHFERFLRSKIQQDFDLKGVPIQFQLKKTVGREVKKNLLKHNAKSRRGKGHGEGRGVGPNKRNVPIEHKKNNDKQDTRRRRDTRLNRLRK